MVKKFAVDFGTTNTVISQWMEEERQPRTVYFEDIGTAAANSRPAMIPSLLYIEEEGLPKIAVGKEVLEKKITKADSHRLFSAFKRLIALSHKRFPRKIGASEFSYQEIGALFLGRLFRNLSEAGDPEELVFTLPVDVFAFYRVWLNDLVKKQFPKCKVSLLDESTAAAIGYGLTKPNSLLMVIDFGGGTLDVSLLKLPGQSGPEGYSPQEKSRVMAKGGSVLGGEDIDRWMVEDILQENHGSYEEISDDFYLFKQKAEQVKIILSENDEAAFHYASPEREYDALYTRARLEMLLENHGFYSQVQSVLDQVLHEAQLKGISKMDLDQVVLIGGTCLLPSVQRMVQQIFGAPKVRCDRPFEAVSHGALGLLAGAELDDYICRSYGIRHLNRETFRHEYKLLFGKGTNYPASKPVEMNLACSRHNQDAVELVIAEIQQNVTGINEVVFDGRKIGTAVHLLETETILPLNESRDEVLLVPLDPLGMPGADRLHVKFGIDESRRLIVTVTDLFNEKVLYQDKPVIDLQ